MAEFTDDQAARLMEQFGRYMQADSLTQAQAARRAGVQATILNQLLKGTYAGDRDKYLLALQQFLEREADRADAPSLGRFAETRFAQQILRCCRQNHVHGTIGLVIGDPGRGKTRALKEYLIRTPGVVRVSGGEYTHSPQQLARKIVQAIGDAKYCSTFQQAAEAIIDHFRGSSSLLIIDQAHQLDERALSFVQNLWDDCNEGGGGEGGGGGENRFGIVLAATSRLSNNLIDQKNTYIYEQLTSRIDIGFTAKLTGGFSLEDIKKVFAAENVPYPLHPATLAKLVEVANSKGGLRKAIAEIEHWQEWATKKRLAKDTEITVAALNEIEQQVMFQPSKWAA